MENLSEHLKENVTYINGLFENAMDYIEREFMVGTVPAALLTLSLIHISEPTRRS